MKYKYLVPISLAWVCLLFANPLYGQDDTTRTDLLNTLFIQPEQFVAGEQNWSIASADIDGDGDLDMLTASRQDNRINVNFNDGTGTFTRKAHFPGPKDARSIITFDANADGKPDVASVGTGGEMVVLLNAGNGTFTGLQRYPAGTTPHDLTAIDLDGDGNKDLAVVDADGNKLYRFLNQGNGRFSPQTPLQLMARSNPRCIITADLDGNGAEDMVIGAKLRLYLLFNQGGGRFTLNKSVRSTEDTWALGAGDFDKDGDLDIAAGCYLDKSLYIHPNRGGGVFDLRDTRKLASGDHNFDLTVVDLNNDSWLDVVTCSSVDNSVSFHLNDGRGNIQEPQKITSGLWNSGVTAGDVDGDGDIDVVVSSIDDNYINVHASRFVELTTRKKPNPCVRGVIYNGETKQPIPNAQVQLRTADNERVQGAGTIESDEKGRYQFCPPGNRDYVIVVRTPGWEPQREPFHMPEEDFEKDIYLQRGSFVYGTVTDAKTGETLTGATVSITNRDGLIVAEALTDAEGNYREEVKFGLYRVRGSYPEYEDRLKRFRLTIKDVPAGKRVDLALPPVQKIPCLIGTVTDEETGEPIPNAQIVVRDKNQTVDEGVAKPIVTTIITDEKGNYRECLPFGAYELNCTAEGYFFSFSEVEIPETREEDLRHDITLNTICVGCPFVLEAIYFDVAKYTLRPKSIHEMERLLEVMEENPRIVVEISGHTDSDDTDENNLILSDNRAKAVVDFLLERGIPMERMVPRGYGEAQPRVPNDSPENKQLNRRTEFKVLEIRETEVGEGR